jgi:hypothetical protein
MHSYIIGDATANFRAGAGAVPAVLHDGGVNQRLVYGAFIGFISFFGGGDVATGIAAQCALQKHTGM